MIDVIKRIKDLMEMRGWTCYELSAQTGISTNAIYDWFKIGAEPSLSNIVKICEAMGISLELFFCGEAAYQLSKYFGIDFTPHRASNDAEATIKIYNRLRENN